MMIQQNSELETDCKQFVVVATHCDHNGAISANCKTRVEHEFGILNSKNEIQQFFNIFSGLQMYF